MRRRRGILRQFFLVSRMCPKQNSGKSLRSGNVFWGLLYSPFSICKNPLKSVDFRGFLVRVARLERAASTSQSVTESFFKKFIALFSHFCFLSFTFWNLLRTQIPSIPCPEVAVPVVRNIVAQGFSGITT